MTCANDVSIAERVGSRTVRVGEIRQTGTALTSNVVTRRAITGTARRRIRPCQFKNAETPTDDFCDKVERA
ncbi:MAG: hypothetical protein ABL961_11430 [Vicinamibacterales bacterium]